MKAFEKGKTTEEKFPAMSVPVACRCEHGQYYEECAGTCIYELSKADQFFAWIDRPTLGSLAEIGAARALKKPSFVAFATRGLSEEFYFAAQLADIAVVASDAQAAWRLFTLWAP